MSAQTNFTILEAQEPSNSDISHDLHIIKKKSQKQKVSMADSSEANALYQAHDDILPDK